MIAGSCDRGWPNSFRFIDTELHVALIVIHPSSDPKNPDAVYPGPERRRIGALILKIREDNARAETRVRFATVPWHFPGLELPSETGGYVRETRQTDRPIWLFAPAAELKDGTVHIERPSEARILRGDANADGRVDVSDPLAVLMYLFWGQPAACADAGDADDNGQLEMADAIVSLSTQFLGARSIQPPYPECGVDATDDALACESHRGCESPR